MLSAIWCNAQYLPATTGTFEQGLRYVYQEGNYSVLPTFPTTLIQDTAHNFTLTKAKRKEYYALKYSGFVKLPSDKIYTFYSQSDDGSRVYIDDSLVVNKDGQHIALEKSGAIGLMAGYHKIEVLYFNAAGVNGVLKIQYQSSTISKKEIPVTMLFRTKGVVVKPTDYYTKYENDSILNKRTIYIRPKNVKKGLNGAMDTLETNQ